LGISLYDYNNLNTIMSQQDTWYCSFYNILRHAQHPTWCFVLISWLKPYIITFFIYWGSLNPSTSFQLVALLTQLICLKKQNILTLVMSISRARYYKYKLIYHSRI